MVVLVIGIVSTKHSYLGQRLAHVNYLYTWMIYRALDRSNRTFISALLGGVILLSSTFTSPGGILFIHWWIIRMLWRISSIRIRYLKEHRNANTLKYIKIIIIITDMYSHLLSSSSPGVLCHHHHCCPCCHHCHCITVSNIIINKRGSLYKVRYTILC